MSNHTALINKGLYLHIPFCKSKCAYCDFFSVVSQKNQQAFVDALCLEMAQEAGFFEDHVQRPTIQTIYFGGGTPSLLSETEFRQIFDQIDQCFDLTNCAEITLEANPDDLQESYLQMLGKFPFNRISIGVQSLNDGELQRINRRHSAADAAKVVRLCADMGFRQISVDLMYGLPGQSLESLQLTLERMLEWPVTHISTYALSWEEGSVLYRDLKRGLLQEASDECLESAFFYIKNRLESAGFDHYELSNFAKPGCRSKHNSSYWNGSFYLGLGPSAHSYNGKQRRWNPASLNAYIEGVQANDLKRSVESMNADMLYNDYVMTRMRTKEGVDLQDLGHLFGLQQADLCLKRARMSLLAGNAILKSSRLKLTRKGLFVSDMVVADLLNV